MVDEQSRNSSHRPTPSSAEGERKLAEKKAKTYQSRTTSSSWLEPKSAQELCDQLRGMVQKKEWDKSLAEHFIQIVVNPKKQYQLNSAQKSSVLDSILKCPSKYRALVHLLILSENFNSQNKLHTLDGIAAGIIAFVKDELELESRIEANLLKIQGNEVLLDWLKKKLKVKEESLFKKLDLIRNLISYLIGAGETIAISSRLDIILEAFADSNYLRQYTEKAITLEKVTQHRVKAIVDLFCLDKPTTTEPERLILFGSSVHNLFVYQLDEISQLRDNFENERQTSHKKDKRITDLESRCKELENEIVQTKKELEHEQDELKQEKIIYEQLKASSIAKISQQRNSALNEVRSRIEHELQKLERCFNGKADSFAENSKMGLKIIGKIRDRLSD
ncbi:MAG: HAD-IG family 5'-nucleotidase [Coleofasciculaceae cyanobacterium SM2_1_6]|nr:HAD-IG family 5'-nucleotidase [Coleofasciculaceae cyanobacterium SM2_1_6]